MCVGYGSTSVTNTVKVPRFFYVQTLEPFGTDGSLVTMKKNYLGVLFLLLFNLLNAQFNSSLELLEFSKKPFKEKQMILSKSGWKIFKTLRRNSEGYIVGYEKTKKSGTFHIVMQNSDMLNNIVDVTELYFPDYDYAFNDFILGLLRNYGFTEPENGVTTHVGKRLFMQITQQSSEVDMLQKIMIMTTKSKK